MIELDKMVGGKKALVIDQKDNVAVALTDLNSGDKCMVVEDSGKQFEISVMEQIPFGHKFALNNMKKNEPVFKYGEEIGKLKEPISKGGWIHSHNMSCDRGMA